MTNFFKKKIFSREIMEAIGIIIVTLFWITAIVVGILERVGIIEMH